MAKNNNDVVIISLDRDREIRYGHKALKMMMAITGKSMEELDIDNFEIEDLEKYIYCGIFSDAKKNGEDLRLEQMEDILDEAPSYQHIIEKMQEAFAASFGSFIGAAAEGNGQPGKPKKAGRGTGTKA